MHTQLNAYDLRSDIKSPIVLFSVPDAILEITQLSHLHPAV